MNLIEGLQEEINRCSKLIKIYNQLPNNSGFFGATMIKQDIFDAEKAIGSGDTIKMLKCYGTLKDCE